MTNSTLAAAAVRLFGETELSELVAAKKIPGIQATSLRNAGRVVPDGVNAMYCDASKTALYLSENGETVMSAATGQTATAEQTASYLDWLNSQSLDSEPTVREPLTRQVRQGTFGTVRNPVDRVARSDKRGQQERKERTSARRSNGKAQPKRRQSNEPSHRIDDFETGRGDFSLLVIEDGDSRFPARINPIQAQYILDWMASDEAGLIEALETVAQTGDHE